MTPDGPVGIPLNMVGFRPAGREVAEAMPAERASLDTAGYHGREWSGSAKVTTMRPLSVACALATSPVGLLAW